MRIHHLLAAALLLGASALADSPRIDDAAGVLRAAPAWTARESEDLAAFEARTGIKVLVQFHAQSPSDAEDKVDGQYMTGLSTRLRTVEHGVLMVYFADDGSWRVWIGNALTPVFVGKAGTAAQFTASGEMHQAKEAYLERAQALADTTFLRRHARPQLAAGDRRSPEYLALWTDALIHGLTERLGETRRRAG